MEGEGGDALRALTRKELLAVGGALRVRAASRSHRRRCEQELLELLKSMYVRRPLLQAAFHFYGRAAAPASLPSRLAAARASRGKERALAVTVLALSG